MHLLFAPTIPLHRQFSLSTPVTSTCFKDRKRLVSRATLDVGRPTSRHAIIVGAGVAGLTAAKQLADAGVSVTLLEASDDVGGRIRTDIVDGFILDRGFQVFIEAYPKCAK